MQRRRSHLELSVHATRGLVSRRRVEQAWVAAHRGRWSTATPTAPPSDLRGLPAGFRYLSAAMLVRRATYDARPVVLGTGRRSPGRPARGDGTPGTVQVIRDESQFGAVRPRRGAGMAHHQPGMVGALRSDRRAGHRRPGCGVREYGIPAVLATRDATRRRRDGDAVTVDGAAGVVRWRHARRTKSPRIARSRASIRYRRVARRGPRPRRQRPAAVEGFVERTKDGRGRPGRR
jgi:hypothetical protein